MSAARLLLSIAVVGVVFLLLLLLFQQPLEIGCCLNVRFRVVECLVCACLCPEFEPGGSALSKVSEVATKRNV